MSAATTITASASCLTRGTGHTPMGDTGMCFYLLQNWQNSKRNSPLFGNSTLSGYPSTWNPAEKDIKTMPPQSGAGRTPTKRKRNRLPGIVISRGSRQTVVPRFGGFGYFMPRCLCPCQQKAQEERGRTEGTHGAYQTPEGTGASGQIPL